MWIYYDLTMHVRNLAGGIPKHKDLVKSWQESNWPTGRVAVELEEKGITPETAAEKTIDELGDNAVDEAIDKVWTGFAMNEGRIVLENRNVKAMFKESANIVKDLHEAQINGKKVALRAKLAERVFVDPVWITILDDIHPDLEPEIISPERPIHVMTARGPRTALKRVDQVTRARLVCTLKVLDDPAIKISEKHLRLILDHASENGIGTDRSQGCGVFTYELTKRED